MPLDKSGTKASVGRNIATETAAGKPRAQAVAIAINTARKAGADIPKPKREREPAPRKSKSFLRSMAQAYGKP